MQSFAPTARGGSRYSDSAIGSWLDIRQSSALAASQAAKNTVDLEVAESGTPAQLRFSLLGAIIAGVRQPDRIFSASQLRDLDERIDLAVIELDKGTVIFPRKGPVISPDLANRAQPIIDYINEANG